MIDLYLQTTSRADCIADLAALGLVTIPPAAPEGQPPAPDCVPAPGVALDYIGQLVQTPDVIDASTLTPTVTTPALFYPGERANLRLFGPDTDVQAQAAALRAASPMPHGTTVIDPPPAQPKRRWDGS
jgi:hypothetical protein